MYSIVNHDTEDEIGVTGYEKPGDYKRKLNYKTSLQDIRTFISRHTNCRQFIKVIFKVLYKLFSQIKILFILFLFNLVIF